jgi:hypothetical protein
MLAMIGGCMKYCSSVCVCAEEGDRNMAIEL